MWKDFSDAVLEDEQVIEQWVWPFPFIYVNQTQTQGSQIGQVKAGMYVLCVNVQKMVWKDAYYNKESVSLGIGGFEQRLKHFTLFHN